MVFIFGTLQSSNARRSSLDPLDRRVWFSSRGCLWRQQSRRAVLTPSIEGCGFHQEQQHPVRLIRGVLTPSIEGCGFHLKLPSGSICYRLIRLNPLDRRVWFSSGPTTTELLLAAVCLNPLDRRVWFSSRGGRLAPMPRPKVLTPSIEGCGFHPARGARHKQAVFNPS